MNRLQHLSYRKKLFILIPGVIFVTTILSAAWLLRGGFNTLDTKPYQPPSQQHSFSDWRDVLAHAGPITLTTLTVGTITMDRALNLDPDNPKTKTYRGHIAPLSVLVHSLHHKQYGDFLVDAGFGRDFYQDPPYGNYSQPMRLFNRAFGVRNAQLPGQDIANQLKTRHIRPKAVFFTHFHADHTAGVTDLPNDIDYVFGKNENWFLARAFLGGYFDAKHQLKTLDFSHAQPMPPFAAVIDLFGDGSLWAISTPGHTRDHISYLVNSTTGPIMLTGDASHFGWAFDNDVAPRGLTEADTQTAQQSLDQLRAFKKMFPQVKFIFGHEIPQDSPLGKTD